MKPIILIALVVSGLGAVVAVALFQATFETETTRNRALDYFDSERPPTHGGQQMKPRWGG